MNKVVEKELTSEQQEILELKQMVKNLNEQINNKKESILLKNNDSNIEDEDIPFKKFIKVMSLMNHKLTLSTEGYGKGKIYDFNNFGQIKNILYDDLAEIIHNNLNFAEQGAFFIMNPHVVKLHQLESHYEKFLSKDKILNILSLDSEEIKTLFKNTTRKIQNTIVSIIKEKMLLNETVDLNKLQIISNIYGEDIPLTVKEMKNKIA